MSLSDQSYSRESYEAYVDAFGYVLGWLSCSEEGRVQLVDLVVAARESEGLSERAGLLLNDATALAIREEAAQ